MLLSLAENPLNLHPGDKSVIRGNTASYVLGQFTLIMKVPLPSKLKWK